MAFTFLWLDSTSCTNPTSDTNCHVLSDKSLGWQLDFLNISLGYFHTLQITITTAGINSSVSSLIVAG
jgi:hypothetical protein